MNDGEDRFWGVLKALSPLRPSSGFRSQLWDRIEKERTDGAGEKFRWDAAVPSFLFIWAVGVVGGLGISGHFGSLKVAPTERAVAVITSPIQPDSLEGVFLRIQPEGLNNKEER